MQTDLTQEEMNLISQLFTQPNLSMNRESMIAYVNLTTSVLKKFQGATLALQQDIANVKIEEKQPEEK